MEIKISDRDFLKLIILILMVLLTIIVYGHPFIVVENYSNCTCPDKISTFWGYNEKPSKCCYPEELNCTKDCIYPVGVHYVYD